MSIIHSVSRRTVLAGLTASLASTRAFAPLQNRDVAADWPAIELWDSQQQRFKVEDSVKKLTLMILWASWCAVCMKLLPTILNVAAAVGEQNIDVVLISHPDDWLKDHEIIRRLYPALRSVRPSDANSESALYSAFVSSDDVFYVPRSMLYRRDSKAIVWSHVGGVDWMRPSVIAGVRKWLL